MCKKASEIYSDGAFIEFKIDDKSYRGHVSRWIDDRLCGVNVPYFYGFFKNYVEILAEDIVKLVKPEVISNEKFNDILVKLLYPITPKELLRIPGIYEILSEHYNNDVIKIWEDGK